MTARQTRRLLGLVAAGLATIGLAPVAGAEEVNLYSSRHYDSDRTLYEAFTKETGIRVRLIEGDADQLIERIRNEGANSPADVFITVDAARLARAAQAGILAPFASKVVEQRIPAGLRSKDGLWFAISQRARVVMYDKEKGAPEGLSRYEDLAGPAGAGLCVRSSNHPYNISLAASVLIADGQRRPRPGRRASPATWRGRPRAATATSSAPSPPGSAPWRWPIPTTSPPSAPRRSRRTRRCSGGSASSSPTRARATAGRM